MKRLVLEGSRLALMDDRREPLREEPFSGSVEELPGLVERCLGRPARLSRREVRLSLGSPWVRVQSLPQLDSVPINEVSELVAARPDRFFRVMEKGWVTGASRARTRSRESARTMAAAAPGGPLRAVDQAAGALGWRLVQVHPAQELAAAIDLRLPEQRARQAHSDRKRLAVALAVLMASLFAGPLADVLALGLHEARLRSVLAEQAPAVAAVERARAEALPHLRAMEIRDSVRRKRYVLLQGLLAVVGALPAEAHLTSVSADSAVLRIEGHAREPLEVRAALDTLHWSDAPVRAASLWTGTGSAQGRRPFTLELMIEGAR